MVKFAVVGGLAVCLAGALALAAGADKAGKAKVGDLVGAIAAKNGMKAADLKAKLEARGLKLRFEDTLTHQTAAELLQEFGVSVRASQGSREVDSSEMGRFSSLIAVSRVTAEDIGGGDGRDEGEVVNRGRKTRAGGNSPNSNADVNAFETLREDPRD
jgi:hypothetical protein